ncbi:MAG TPA: c-type cytochrome [Xanthomonadales bacterium]|nr:c-type cytochrome [Xanthomonadales bacterium]
MMRALLLMVLLATAAPAPAQDVARGKLLYAQWCTACHASDPSADRPRLASNNPDALELAIASRPEMRFLGAVLTAADIDDIAAYIGSVVDPQSGVRPATGWYWNGAESGRGFFYERRGDAIYLAGFHYESDGRADWFVVPGYVQAGRFAAPMVELAGGQTLSGPYRAPAETPSPGFAQLTFVASDALTLTWPGGVTPLRRFPFGNDGTVQAPQADAPESGWWWNPAESGRGFALEFQGTNLFACGFMYDEAGLPVWYLTAGEMATPQRYEGTWQRFANGQAMGAPWRAPIVTDSDAGAVTISFTDPRNGTMTLPDGRTIPITRFSF